LVDPGFLVLLVVVVSEQDWHLDVGEQGGVVEIFVEVVGNEGVGAVGCFQMGHDMVLCE
jgi:hypothetical protein